MTTKKAAPAKEKPVAVDWEAVERDYRTGILSLSEIGLQHGVTKGRISIVARRDGWERDLSAKIKAKAAAKVNDAAVNGAVNAERRLLDSERVEVAATMMAQVVVAQKGDIKRYRTLCMSLLSELEAQTGDVASLVALGEMLRAEDDRGVDKLNDVYRAVIGLPERTKTMKALAESLKVLIGLEREAFGIEATPQKVDVEHGGSVDVNATLQLSDPLARALDALAGAAQATGDQAPVPD